MSSEAIHATVAANNRTDTATSRAMKVRSRMNRAGLSRDSHCVMMKWNPEKAPPEVWKLMRMMRKVMMRTRSTVIAAMIGRAKSWTAMMTSAPAMNRRRAAMAGRRQVMAVSPPAMTPTAAASNDASAVGEEGANAKAGAVINVQERLTK
jgi:hypothetical protein